MWTARAREHARSHVVACFIANVSGERKEDTGVSAKTASEWQETGKFNSGGTNTTLGDEKSTAVPTQKSKAGSRSNCSRGTQPLLPLPSSLSLSRPEPSLSDDDPRHVFIPSSQSPPNLVMTHRLEEEDSDQALSHEQRDGHRAERRCQEGAEARGGYPVPATCHAPTRQAF